MCVEWDWKKDWVKRASNLSHSYAKNFLSISQSTTFNDGHKSLLHERFDQELQVASNSGKFEDFKECHFGSQGYTTAAVLYYMDEFKNVLQNPRSNNLLVHICNLYINADFIIVGLLCLAWFTRKVTMPFLTCVRSKSILNFK